MRKVLVVDDEQFIGTLIKRGLESTKAYEVSICSDSREAVVAVKNQRPDNILADINMPGLSGPELIQQLQNDKNTQSIPCIFMTGDLITSDEVGRGKVKTVCIAKPFKTPDLLRHPT